MLKKLRNIVVSGPDQNVRLTRTFLADSTGSLARPSLADGTGSLARPSLADGTANLTRPSLATVTARLARTIRTTRATSAARMQRPHFSPTASRAALLEAAKGAPTEKKLAIARHLVRLRNFRSAATILHTLPFEELDFEDRHVTAIAFLNGTDGRIADALLAHTLSELREQPLPVARAGRLAEWIQLSGWEPGKKIRVLKTLQVQGKTPAEQARFLRDQRYREFKIRTSALERVDVLEYYGTDKEAREHPDQLRYVNDLLTHGHEDEARRLLEHQLGTHAPGTQAPSTQAPGTQVPSTHAPGTQAPGTKPLSTKTLSNVALVQAALRFRHGELLTDLEAIPAAVRTNPGVLALAHDNAAVSAAHKDLFDASLKEAIAAFPTLDVYAKDALLRVLVVKDLLPHLADAAPQTMMLPDTLLGAACGQGLIAMGQGHFQDAAQLLRTVLAEDPAFNAAATGLRFTLARLNTDDTVMSLRDEVGYGAASAGRPGLRTGDRDQATTLIMTGDYLRSWSVRRTAPHWQILSRDLGDKFLNYAALPEDPGASLFLIADDGVGDEIRGTQFYAQLAERYRVTATCDPRLKPLLERSFPTMTFVGVPRRVRGILTPVFDGRYSDAILASHLPAHCDEHVRAAKYVTFGQNLMFNRFAGVLGREDAGASLIPDPARATPRQEDTLTVGLVWKSHFSGGSRKMMYLGLEQLAPLLGIPGVEYWSIQHAVDAQETELMNRYGIRQIEGIDLFDDLDGLAAAVASIDLVIGISTVPMEIAAAVGTPVWLLGFSPENYLYRTAGGRTEVDQLSRNSTVIAPPGIDFTQPYQECVAKVLAEGRRRLDHLARTHRASSPA